MFGFTSNRVPKSLSDHKLKKKFLEKHKVNPVNLKRFSTLLMHNALTTTLVLNYSENVSTLEDEECLKFAQHKFTEYDLIFCYEVCLYETWVLYLLMSTDEMSPIINEVKELETLIKYFILPELIILFCRYFRTKLDVNFVVIPPTN